MKIKIGDYVKVKNYTDWERVSLYRNNYFSADGYWNPIPIDDITEVLPYGELVEVSLGCYVWEKQIFISYDKGFEFPFRCVSSHCKDSFRGKVGITTTA